MSWPIAWAITTNAITLLATFFIILESRLRFDRLAGRIPGSSGPAERAIVREEEMPRVQDSRVREEAGVSS
jgi:hypothetical protein